MATITQQPAALALTGIIANPFNLLLTFTSITTATGASVAWSSVTSPTVLVTDAYGNSIAGSSPTITSPQNFELLLSFTASQASAISNAQSARWALEVTLEGTGPSSIVGGPLTFVPPSWPASSTSTTANLAVSIGTNTASLDVALGGASGVIDMTSDDGSVDLSPSGSGPIIDLSVAHIDGGNAYT